jgi:hypothetical protein
MTYEEFINKGTEYYMNMVKLIDCKMRYRMELTEEEKVINDYIQEFQQQVVLNELRDKFEKCLDVDPET